VRGRPVGLVVKGEESLVWCAAEVGGAAAHLRLHLASDRVCPNSPHASLEEVSGAAQADQRVMPKARSGSPRHVGSRQAAGSVTSLPTVPLATVNSHGVRLTQTTHSWRSRAAATAVRAWPSLSRLCWRLVKWA
jgi:hypothetical protein